jgi:crossover junction endodeoxyribonuclease RuvC
VKKSVTGNGRAEKAQVSHMVGRLLGEPPEGAGSHDLSDALAVALCHLSALRFAGAVRRGDGPG